MNITKKSSFTGVTHTRDINVSQEQLDRWHNGELIQNVLSHLSTDDREFLMSGITPDEWNNAFGDENG